MKRALKYLFAALLLVSCNEENKTTEKSSEIEEDVNSGVYLEDVETKKSVNQLDIVSYKDVTMKPSEFVEVIKKRKTRATKVQQIGDFTYYVTSLPKEYMVYNELRTNTISQEVYDSIAEEYGDMSYYLVEVETKDQQELARYNLVSQGQYSERIEYLSFEMEKNITMNLSNGEEIPCALFHFERTYNVSPKNTFLMGFQIPEDQLNKDIQMVIDDRLFEQGFIKFKWHPEDVGHLPKVELL